MFFKAKMAARVDMSDDTLDKKRLRKSPATIRAILNSKIQSIIKSIK